MEPKLEYCKECGEPTDRSGLYDDSLYVDYDGPFCEDCYEDKTVEIRTIKGDYGEG